MKRTTLRKTGATGIAVLALSMGLVACGSDDSEDTSASDTTSSSAPATSDAPSEDTSASASASEDATSASTEPFGPSCNAIPANGKGSLEGMTSDPVATAASNNPLLKTLVSAVGAVPGLADTLNSAPALTVFAPTDDAFAKIPEADLNAVLADQTQLTAILSHHVVGERLDPTAVVGEHETLNGDQVTVDGDAEAGMTVDNGTANVICGNVQTANANVYVIDSVLMPTN
ncbi:fasciclin domain-containing protein [Nocardioides flavescens]|uniref:Fasciclin domain-containing protein n=1 Tax=Nocardioides flavescens TaxID=2691959 RepID=A0A6L7F269_9ACTN|nr:fasciclin domain-containing protein [Nocardioides flavescens]MXG91231.1 fasciclin domain-containing protein [Nocardioides flavescens]